MVAMNESEVRRRPGGRSARVRRDVLDATMELLLEKGVDRLTVGEVATRAGVHETSIYRRWGTRDKLLIDALLTNSEQHLPIPDTGSLLGDLTAFATELTKYLSDQPGAALTRTMAGASDDPAVEETRNQFWQARMDKASVMITNAIERGELPDTTDPRLALEMLVAPIHFRTLLTHQPLDTTLPRQLAELVVKALGPNTSPKPTP